MKITEIAFTCYAVSDINKTRAFYEGIFGLTPNGDFPATPDAYWVEYNIGSGTLALAKASDKWKISKDGASIALEIEDFDKAVEEIKKNNVKIVMGPSEFPSCHVLIVEDPDGNKVGIHKRKQK